MRLRHALLSSPLFLLACTAPAAAQHKFFFKDGDVVVVMGDSITEQRLYSNYLETWTITRFPSWKLTFRNVGIGGDTAGGGNGRFKRDVLDHSATALTVDFGMNDAGYRWVGKKYTQKIKEKVDDQFVEKTVEKTVTASDIDNVLEGYKKNQQAIADQAKAAKIRVAWVTPQPIERGEPGPQLVEYNLTLEKYSAGVGEIAKKNDGHFCDQFHPYLAVIEKARATDPKIRITGGDAVHPGPPGQALMAASILKAMNFPREVASVSIDVSASSGPKATNCKIMSYRHEDGVIKLTRVDNALPFFPEDAKSILKWAPLLDDMNHYGLTVKGLKPGKYDIRLGGKAVAEHTADELAKGVNLAEAALKAGPVSEQVRTAWKAVQAKTDYFRDNIFRGVQLAGDKNPIFKEVAPKDLEEKRKTLYAERILNMAKYDLAIRDALVMRPYEMEIVPAGTK